MKIQQRLEGIIQIVVFTSGEILRILCIKNLSIIANLPEDTCLCCIYSCRKADGTVTLCYLAKYDKMMCNVSHFGFN